jgi:hypothetical protein
VEKDEGPLKEAYLGDGQFAERVYDSDLNAGDKKVYIDKLNRLRRVRFSHAESVRDTKWWIGKQLGDRPIHYKGYSNYQIVDSSEVTRIAKVDMHLESEKGREDLEIHFLESLGRP